MLYTWSTTVLLNNIPTPMSFVAPNAAAARAYFETFGKIIAEVKMV